MRYHLIAFIVLMVVLLALYLSTDRDDIEVESRTSELAAQEFDYFMADFETTRFLPGGHRHFHLSAQRLTHYPEPDHAILEQPRITIYRESGNDPPWRVRSVSARIAELPDEAGQRIDFMGDVVITRQDGDGETLSIYTQFLSVYPQTRSASTDDPVFITSAGGEIRSTGMRADLSGNHIELLADIRGHYDYE